MLAPVQRARLARAWREGGFAPWDALLVPLALAYRGGLALRRAAYAWGVRKARSLPCPVVAVGNLTVGGTGKTALVELLARHLAGHGRRVAILSRGYGRRGGAPVAAVSDPGGVRLSAREAGDEPLVLARRLPGVPVVVGRDRFEAGAWALRRFRPDLLLLDDGFQQRRLRKDLDVVCLDARAPWDTGRLLPRGGLREPPSALARADLLVLTHAAACPGSEELRAGLHRWAPGVPVASATYEVEGVEDLGSGVVGPPEVLQATPFLAFAGLARPEGFRQTLGRLGVVPRDFVAFPDHHPYGPGDVATLEVRARARGAEVLLTTEKDAVRWPGGGSLPVWALRVGLRLAPSDARWWAVLETRLGLP